MFFAGVMIFMNKLLVLSFCVIFVLAACGGAESRKEKYLQSGHDHYHNDDCKKAKLEYRNVLQIDPKTVDALIGLSRCEIEDKEWRSAYQLLLGALENDPNSIDAKTDLAKIHLIAGDNSKAYEMLEEVFEIETNNATAIALRGIFHLKNNTLTAARTDSELSLSIENHNLTAITLLSSLGVKTGDVPKAITHIEQQLDIAELTKRERKELQLMSIALYSQLNDTANIIRIYSNLIEQYPDNNTYKYRLAGIYAEDGKIDDAENILVSNIETSDDKLAYVSFLNKYKTANQATEQLKEYAQNGDGKLNLALARRYKQLDENELAEEILADLANNISEPEHIEAKNELALIALKANDADTTFKLVGEVLAEQPTNIRALIMRGSIAVARRDAPAAIADFRTVLRDQPTNTYAIRQLAVAYILNDQRDLAKELLQKAVTIDSNDKSLGLLYARLQGTDQEFDSAIDTVNELLKNEQDDLETIKTLFDLQIANEDYSGAKLTAESMKAAMEDNPLGYYLTGVLLQNENNPTAAEQQYLIALEKQPRANEALSGLIRLYLSQQLEDKAISYLQTTIEKDPEYLIPYNLLGEVALSKKDYSLAVESFESAIEVNDQWWIPYRGLSLAYLAQGNRAEALKILENGFENSSGTERLGIELANIYYQQGDRDKAIKTYNSIIKKVPTSIVAKNNLAMLLVDENSTDDEINSALEYSVELETIEQAASLDTAGWVNYKAGNIEKAIDLLNKAIVLAPEAGELHYHLGMAYAAEGEDIEKAKHHLTIAAQSEQEYKGKQVAIDKLKTL